jgi:glutamyl-tRNA reductase
MALSVVGLSHRTAAVELRERLTYGRAEVPALLGRLRAAGAEEAAVLSTCNRTELYLSLPDPAAGEEAARRLLAERSPGVEGSLYAHRDRDAVRHLFRVAAGLDSMILGEPQIQGQVREAYQAARETADPDGPVVGAVLNRLFQHALGAGGRVRSETELGLGAASISTAAVELA